MYDFGLMRPQMILFKKPIFPWMRYTNGSRTYSVSIPDYKKVSFFANLCNHIILIAI